ncbi:MAG: hypothetical protein ACRC0V_07045 [Fusobacteriaceae bacterium]
MYEKVYSFKLLTHNGSKDEYKQAVKLLNLFKTNIEEVNGVRYIMSTDTVKKCINRGKRREI